MQALQVDLEGLDLELDSLGPLLEALQSLLHPLLLSSWELLQRHKRVGMVLPFSKEEKEQKLEPYKKIKNKKLDGMELSIWRKKRNSKKRILREQNDCGIEEDKEVGLRGSGKDYLSIQVHLEDSICRPCLLPQRLVLQKFLQVFRPCELVDHVSIISFDTSASVCYCKMYRPGGSWG
jgi:hypothetical protein